MGSKQQQRWLWSAIDHRSGKMWAYVLAPHENSALLKLKALLQPFGLTRFYDAWAD
ncbi:IS1 family transposase [Leptothoe sp. PORK10 BA2]|uniref:IS1 family transposase n=1 Tax=Leptothoe sp. PORK10 BA2 TaxID=3110254 RepID=UPI002B213DC0|nr:IS1 family transposase [Leptothoe sp. PORK10 BA2]MEA5466696.1 IS1 family transposase [Leptothoe sp. PORK10 BA2]